MLATVAAGAAVIGVGFYVRRYGNGVAYNLYAHTPLARILHNRALTQARAKPAHTDLSLEADRVHRLNKHTYVRLVPYLSDNFGYLVVDEATNHVAVVDPGDAVAILAAVEDEKASRPGLVLSHLLVTHHHADHSGGVADIVRAVPNVNVVGGRNDRIPCVTQSVADGDVVHVGRLAFTVLDTPSHTKGHVCFALGDQALFTGDFMFQGGCGRFFEGSAAEMRGSFDQLKRYPDSALVFCGHEYTKSNLEFAARLVRDSAADLALALRTRLDWAKERRATNRPTVPSTLGQERTFNLFLLSDDARVAGVVRDVAGAQASLVVKAGSEEGMDVRAVAVNDATSVMRALRAIKDAGL